MALDLSADYLVIDDPVTVTYYRKTSRTAYAAGVSVTYVQHEERNQSTIDPLLADRKTFFHLWRARLTAAGISADPAPGDVIEFGSVRHTVDKVDHYDRDANGVQRYRCSVTRE